jgi:hypothetical protein
MSGSSRNCFVRNIFRSGGWQNGTPTISRKERHLIKYFSLFLNLNLEVSLRLYKYNPRTHCHHPMDMEAEETRQEKCIKFRTSTFQTYSSPLSTLYSGAGIAQWYSAVLRAGRSGVRVPRQGLGTFLFTTASRLGSGTHPTYPMGTRVSFLGGKMAGAWSWPLTCN